jgi:hypothetical protein
MVEIHAHAHMIDHGFSEEFYGNPEDCQQPDGYMFYDDCEGGSGAWLC